MNLPRVQFTLPNRQPCWLSPGAIIGRLATAELQLTDPRVSEAHALVSLRGGRVVLLALRRGFRVGGHDKSSAELVPGLKIELASNLWLEVAKVELPREVLRVDGLPAGSLVLSAQVYSLLVRQGRLEAEPTFVGDAAAHLWSAGGEWFWKHGEQPAVEVHDGSGVDVEGNALTFVASSVDTLFVAQTEQAASSSVHLLLYKNYLVLEYTGRRVRFGGRLGEVLRMMHQYDRPVDWTELARRIWPDAEPKARRQSWDRATYRIRKMLREADFPTHVLDNDRFGNFQLRLDAP